MPATMPIADNDFYFRPKTPTQWHIEGIRKAGECNYGDPTHAAVLVVFALDAKTGTNASGHHVL